MENRFIQVKLRGDEHCLWTYRLKRLNKIHEIAPPVFEIDGKVICLLRSSRGESGNL